MTYKNKEKQRECNRRSQAARRKKLNEEGYAVFNIALSKPQQSKINQARGSMSISAYIVKMIDNIQTGSTK